MVKILLELSDEANVRLKDYMYHTDTSSKVKAINNIILDVKIKKRRN